MTVDTPLQPLPLTAPLVQAPPCETTLRAVGQLLDELLDEEGRRWAGRDGGRALLDDLRPALAGGGKMLRPAFCHWGYVGVAGGVPDPVAVRAAAAVELLHTFALVHDDVMDGSPTRRGRESAHIRQAQRHWRHRWRGERRRFSEGMAVLVGDLAFALANRLACELPPAARAVWHGMCGELVLGQYLDMQGAARGDRSPAYAASVSALKSARYTVVRPLQLGAAVAGGLPRVGPAYAAYGEPLGQAFQLRDDLLGVFGDPDVTGKPAGEDLRAGKPTLLLALAAGRAPSSAQALLERVGRPDMTREDVDALAALCVSTGAREEVLRRIAAAVAQARDALAASPVDPAAVPGLLAMADAAAWRDR
jgi:geranylgeranyl diphosphate synthase type I